jgi:hypothetical protein
VQYVLFIGNCFTACNDLPSLIASMVADTGKSFRHCLIHTGCASLRSHWNAGHAAKLVEGGQFDAVVLQEQSTLPIKNASRMHENIRLFDQVICAAGATTVLCKIWILLMSSRVTGRSLSPKVTEVAGLLPASTWKFQGGVYPPNHDAGSGRPVTGEDMR